MRVLTIGDIHGSINWKLLDFDKYDKIVFSGDYVDSFDHTNVQILDNLKDIIQFKKDTGDDVILLLGNHDLQYYFSYNGHGCSGYRGTMYQDLHYLFNTEKHLFQMAYQYNNYLWTHAGLSTPWYNVFKKAVLEDSVIDIEEYDTLADQLNVMFERNLECLFDVGHRRGGYKDVGGPFWADREEFQKPKNILLGFHQIVGHTKVKFPMVYVRDFDSSITFIDCLENNQTYTLNI